MCNFKAAVAPVSDGTLPSVHCILLFGLRPTLLFGPRPLWALSRLWASSPFRAIVPLSLGFHPTCTAESRDDSSTVSSRCPACSSLTRFLSVQMPKAKRKSTRRSTTSSPGGRGNRPRPAAPDGPPAPAAASPATWLESLADMVAERLRPASMPAAATPPAAPVAGATVPASSAMTASVAGASTQVASAPATALINDAALQMLGESYAHAAPPAPLSTPPGAHVSASVRAKIWGGHYVAMTELRPPTDTLFSSASSQRSSTSAKATPPSISISEFLSLFNTFIAIRVERHPHEAPGLLKHVETLKSLHRMFGNLAWQHYDHSLRWTMQHNPSIQWGHVDVEIYMQATAIGLHASGRSPRPGAPRREDDNALLQPNTCWRFARTGSCTDSRCVYKDTHLCTKCRSKSHGLLTCPKVPKSGIASAKADSKSKSADRPFQDSGASSGSQPSI